LLRFEVQQGIPGSNDDLAGVGVVLEAGRYLSTNRLKNTEVWIVVFAGEGHMRGSKRFVKKYFDKLKDSILFNFKRPSREYFLVATEERLFFAKHPQRAVEIAKRACERVGANFKVGPLPFAGGDAANFLRKGLHAVTMFGLLFVPKCSSSLVYFYSSHLGISASRAISAVRGRSSPTARDSHLPPPRPGSERRSHRLSGL